MSTIEAQLLYCRSSIVSLLKEPLMERASYFTLALYDSSGLWADNEEPCLKIGERLLKKAWPSKNKYTNFRAEEASPKESFIGPLRWKRRKTSLILCTYAREGRCQRRVSLSCSRAGD